MEVKEKIIGVAPVGNVSAIAAKVVAAHITSVFGFSADILPYLDNPLYAFDKKRSQYDAGKMINTVEKSDDKQYEKLICVCDLDLFVPIFTHVFGEARQGGFCAIVSIFMLYTSRAHDADPIALERLAKISLHEAGHLFNMIHCEDSHCLMHYADTADHLDDIHMNLCRYCLKTFKRNC